MSANIVIITDNSGSMGWRYGPEHITTYMSFAKTDVNTFINNMLNGDGLGLVTFSDNAQIIWPANKQIGVITGQGTKDNAVNCVESIRTLDMTNVSAGITTGFGMIRNAVAPKAMILVSDGDWNVGPDPTKNLETSVPIYTIAMGPLGHPEYLNTIATVTGGIYYNCPSPLDLAVIYNDIVGDTKVAVPLGNEKLTIPKYNYKKTQVMVSQGTSKIRIGVNWGDRVVNYTPNTPADNQINVLLYDPNNKKVDVTPVTAPPNHAYVFFEVDSPLSGLWTVIGWYACAPSLNTLNMTAGVFQPQSSISLELKTGSQLVSCGKPIKIKAAVTDAGEPVSDVKVCVDSHSPLYSVEDALSKYKDVLKKIPVPQEADSTGSDDDLARLGVLYKRMLPRENILAYQRMPLQAVKAKDGTYDISINDTKKKGSYNLGVNVSGYSAKSKTKFSRKRIISVLVK